jgi:hypothetical protein
MISFWVAFILFWVRGGNFLWNEKNLYDTNTNIFMSLCLQRAAPIVLFIVGISYPENQYMSISSSVEF